MNPYIVGIVGGLVWFALMGSLHWMGRKNRKEAARLKVDAQLERMRRAGW